MWNGIYDYNSFRTPKMETLMTIPINVINVFVRSVSGVRKCGKWRVGGCSISHRRAINCNGGQEVREMEGGWLRYQSP